MSKILIVEDDTHILRGLVDNLSLEGFQVVTAADGQIALEQARGEKPDLIILDLMLPKLNGFEVCKQLRKDAVNIPIIILSAKAQEADKVLGLELGADDYVTKPFSPRELIVRIKAVLRRSQKANRKPQIAKFGRIKVDFKRFQVFSTEGRSASGGKQYREIKLTAAEFKVLKLLVDNKNEPVSRHKILAEIWTEEVVSRTVDTHIWNLREKLEDQPSKPKHIVTVHRIGYKFAG